MKILALSIASLFILNSCIKPYACECKNAMTQQKNHILIYATENERAETCKKNGKDTIISGIQSPYLECYLK